MWNNKYPYTKEEVREFNCGLFAENINGRLPLEVVIDFSIRLSFFWFTVEKRYGK